MPGDSDNTWLMLPCIAAVCIVFAVILIFENDNSRQTDMAFTRFQMTQIGQGSDPFQPDTYNKSIIQNITEGHLRDEHRIHYYQDEIITGGIMRPDLPFYTINVKQGDKEMVYYMPTGFVNMENNAAYVDLKDYEGKGIILYNCITPDGIHHPELVLNDVTEYEVRGL